jgi:hypothetical protein
MENRYDYAGGYSVHLSQQDISGATHRQVYPAGKVFKLTKFPVELPQSRGSDDSVMLHLLDPGSGHVVQVWLLEQQPVIKIGREADQHVLISHPHVSRQHAELRFCDGQWQLVSLGRNGVVVDGKRVTDALAHNGFIFRLGVEGPTLRFFDTPPSTNNSVTISADPVGRFALRVDDTKLDHDIREIVDNQYFQQLKGRAHELRRRREGQG